MTAIRLGRRSRAASSHLPTARTGSVHAAAYLMLLPVEIARFTRPEGRLVSVALIRASRRAGVTCYGTLRSPDFPPARRRRAGGRPENSRCVRGVIVRAERPRAQPEARGGMPNSLKMPQRTSFPLTGPERTTAARGSAGGAFGAPFIRSENPYDRSHPQARPGGLRLRRPLERGPCGLCRRRLERLHRHDAGTRIED